MEKEFVLVKIGDKDYLLSSPQKIPQDVRNALMDLVISFNQIIIDGQIDQIEKEALKSIPSFSDALFFVFLRKLIWLSGGWDFTPIQIGITCNPTAYMGA